MYTWKAEYRARWGCDYVVNVAAKSFDEAVKRIKTLARKNQEGRIITIKSLVRTATLNA